MLSGNEVKMTIDEVSKLAQVAFYCVTASVAVIGLNAWRAQMTGRTKYENARNVIAGAFMVRDAIKRCQSPFISVNEWSERTPIPGETEQQKRAGESYFAYGRRFHKVIDAIDKWYPSTVEAEALFGAEAKRKTEALTAVASKLNVTITVFHQLMYHNQITDKHKNYSNILTGINKLTMPDLEKEGVSVDDNNFQAEFNTAMLEIELYFMRHLHR
jgi:hypothetical protein